MKIDVWDYIEEEIEPLDKGEELLSEEQLLARWGITRRALQNARLGRNKRGLKLSTIRIGKNLRYRKKDVLAFEFACRDGQ